MIPPTETPVRIAPPVEATVPTEVATFSSQDATRITLLLKNLFPQLSSIVGVTRSASTSVALPSEPATYSFPSVEDKVVDNFIDNLL